MAKRVSRAAGHAGAFLAACLVILVWVASGPVFGFSDTWQLVINTSTTIVTFLMVFLIQNSQNRDMEALQIKVDELVRALPRAKNRLLDLEELDEEQIEQLQQEYYELARRARLRPRNSGTRRMTKSRPRPGRPRRATASARGAVANRPETRP